MAAFAIALAGPARSGTEPCPGWVEPQQAVPSDMALFENYVGTFRGRDHQAPSGTRYHFRITYAWYDRPRQIFKYTLTTVLPDRGETRPLGEGVYRYDPASGRIEVFGVFVDGRAGRGCMSPFDAGSGSREVAIDGQAPDGTVQAVRDTFWVIDEDSWGNRTFIRDGEGQWQEVSSDTYTRVENR